MSKSTIDTSTSSATSWDNGCDNAKMYLLFWKMEINEKVMITLKDLNDIAENKIKNETQKEIIRLSFPPHIADRMCAAIDGQEKLDHFMRLLNEYNEWMVQQLRQQEAVQQFLRLAESWAECFPTRDIVDAFNLKEVKIGVPGFFDVGTSECLNSASFVMACLKGIEPYELGGHYPGEYENDSWNQTGFRYPWAVNPCLDIPGPKYFVYVQ